MDDIHDIAAFYNSNPQMEHTRLERHRLEFDLTWRYFETYLPAKGSILEIGAATGRYTLPLAQHGYHVTAVDLSAGLLAQCRASITAAGLQDRVQFLVADARDLSAVTGGGFDAVLMMGPLYHLVEESDRKLALQQAYDRLRPGGVLFTAFISRYGIFGDMLQKMPEWIEDQPDVRWLLDHGKRPDFYPKGGFRGYFATVPEIAPLHEAAGFQTLAVAGVEPAISADDASYNNLPESLRPKWLDVLFEISTEPSMVGASRHILYIGKK